MTLDQLLGEDALADLLAALGPDWRETAQEDAPGGVRVRLAKVAPVDISDAGVVDPDAVVEQGVGGMEITVRSDELDWESLHIGTVGTHVVAQVSKAVAPWARSRGINRLRIPAALSDTLFLAAGYQYEDGVLTDDVSTSPARSEQYAAWKLDDAPKPGWA